MLGITSTMIRTYIGIGVWNILVRTRYGTLLQMAPSWTGLSWATLLLYQTETKIGSKTVSLNT